MGAIYFLMILILTFLIMGILLLMGKGSWLIAGYNTMSEKEKKKYDEKKMCKAVGAFNLLVAFLLSVLLYLICKIENGKMPDGDLTRLVWIGLTIIIISVIALVIYLNTRCKRT